MNLYVTLAELKVAIEVTNEANDARLLQLIEDVSRAIDDHCLRHFYVLTATRTFTGARGPSLSIPDLIAVTTLKTDDNKDRTFEVTWASSDYLLEPENADPDTFMNPASRPYTEVLVDLDAGTKAAWPSGRRTVQIVGDWGFWQHLFAMAPTVSGAHDDSVTTLTVSDGTKFSPGMTLRVGSEQLYVSSISGADLTVTRAVNGSTSASISNGAAIQVYRYPGPIREAVIIEASRMWKRKDTSFAAKIGFPETGQTITFRGLDDDAKRNLQPFVRY